MLWLKTASPYGPQHAWQKLEQRMDALVELSGVSVRSSPRK